jgi:predicted transcriptional regulator
MSELQTTEVKRQDLLDMSGLTEALNKNDLVFLTNRGEFDAVIARPSKLAEAMEHGIDQTARAIRARLKQKAIKPTDHDLAMMRVVKQRGGATLTDIGNDVERETANIHGRLKLLCKRGFLRREEGESILYYLTGEGLEALSKPV